MFFKKQDYKKYTQKRVVVIFIISLVLTLLSYLLLRTPYLPIYLLLFGGFFIISHCIYFPKKITSKIILTIVFLLIALFFFSFPTFSYKIHGEHIQTIKDKSVVGYLSKINAWEILVEERHERYTDFYGGIMLIDENKFVTLPGIYPYRGFRIIDEHINAGKILYLSENLGLRVYDLNSAQYTVLNEIQNTLDIGNRNPYGVGQMWRYIGWKDDNTIYYPCNLSGNTDSERDLEFCLFVLGNTGPTVTSETFQRDESFWTMREDLSPPENCLSHLLRAVNSERTSCVYAVPYRLIPVGDASLFGWTDYYVWDEEKGNKLLSRALFKRKDFYWADSGELYMIVEGSTESDREIYRIKNF